MPNIKQHLVGIFRSGQLLEEIREGVTNQSTLLNEKLTLIAEELGRGRRSAEAIRRRGAPPLTIKPLGSLKQIPYPDVDLSQDQAIVSIIGSSEYQAAVRSFEANPKTADALVTPHEEALLYSIIRAGKLAAAIEIGPFVGGASEAIARALCSNGAGAVHAVDPSDGEMAAAVIASWPMELQAHVEFHAMNSMRFFSEKVEHGKTVDLAFINGHHDREYALFDIESAARILNRSGFIVIGGITQPGSFLAAKEFLAKNPSWTEAGTALASARKHLPRDSDRITIANTDFCILRAPSAPSFDTRPMTTGQQPWSGRELTGILLRLAREATGTLHIQYVLRTFDPNKETTIQRSVQLSGAKNEVTIPMAFTFKAGDAIARKTVEPWFVWEGEEPLQLAGPPSIY